MIPLTVGFLVMGPLSGYLSDRLGSRGLATTGMVIMAAAFMMLTLLPANFSYPVFTTQILILGLGMGIVSAPNTTAIMNAVPAEYCGVSSGMIATFRNIASTLSITVIFSLVTVGLAAHLLGTLLGRLTVAGIPRDAATAASHLPPAALADVAAVVSFLRGGRVVHEHDAVGNAEGLAELAGPEIAVLEAERAD